MKFEEKIKKKYIYTDKKNLFRSIYFLYHKYIKTNYKKSYSYNGVDLLIDHFFKNKNNGLYVDIGCYHPIEGSNTYKLYKKGWHGINIDLDTHSINLFNSFRPNDENLEIAVSSSKGSAELFSHHTHSAIQTINMKTAKERYGKSFVSKTIDSNDLNSILEASKFNVNKVDFISIDVEGHEFEILKNFDFKKYQPSIFVIEYNDPSLKKIEFYYQNLENVKRSDLYKLLTENQYHFVNWHHSDLIFVSHETYSTR